MANNFREILSKLNDEEIEMVRVAVQHCCANEAISDQEVKDDFNIDRLEEILDMVVYDTAEEKYAADFRG